MIKPGLKDRLCCVILLFSLCCALASCSEKIQPEATTSDSIAVQTPKFDCTVFIDEQPAFTYFHNDINYISVISLEKYGFDVIKKNNSLIVTRNVDKNIELAPKALINRKKDDELFSKTYSVIQSKQKVYLDGITLNSVNIDGQECIAIDNLSNYAAFFIDEEKQIIKLDYKKKEIEAKMRDAMSETVNYPDAKAAGLEYYVHKFLSGKYSGEISEWKRNGIGVFEVNYIDAGHLSEVKKTTTGYWKNDLADGYQIYESHWENNSLYGEPKKPYNVPEAYYLTRAKYKDGEITDGAFLNIYIRYDLLNKDISSRSEGIKYNDGYDGLYRVSKIDDSYKYGYYVVSETIWDKGDIALSKEDILAKYDEIYPPLNEDEIKELDKNISADLPFTLEESYKVIDKMLKPEDMEKIKSGTEKDLSQYHFGLGQSLRNEWLWAKQSGIYKYFVINGITHPDNMSDIVISGYYHYLNNSDFDVNEYIYQNKKEAVISYLLSINGG